MAGSARPPLWSIELSRLTKFFDERLALGGIDLKIRAGECLAIFGPNGAGKTTLIKILSTIMRPSSGSILIDGLDTRGNAAEVRRKLGVVTHETFLYGNLTAYENLDFYRRLSDMPKERIFEVTAMVGMESRLHDRVSTLSRGMRQRFSIARALIHRPTIMLLDEPETGLDQQAISRLWRVVRGDGQGERTVVLATHNLERGFEFADRLLILYQGKIVYQESKESLDLAGLRRVYLESTRVRV